MTERSTIDGKTWADTFNSLVAAIVYEDRRRTEVELATFLDPGCTIVAGPGPGGHAFTWITFTDASFVGFVAGWCVPFVGMAPEGGMIEI